MHILNSAAISSIHICLETLVACHLLYLAKVSGSLKLRYMSCTCKILDSIEAEDLGYKLTMNILFTTVYKKCIKCQ